jgi:uncharacterized protein (DUF305 family)
VAFARGMVPHHQQAVEMADLALARAASEEVRSLAGRIKATQDPEIRLMQGWPDDWDGEGSSDGNGMLGMEMGGHQDSRAQTAWG